MTDRIRVLHVDDDADFAELTAEFLERTDDRFEVHTETSAADALDRLETVDVDCIVSDYDMPGMDGLAFLETVRETDPDRPFILFTGKGSEAVASDAIAAGATDYLRKRGGSERYELLANRVRNAVEKYRSQRHLQRQSRQYKRLFDQAPVMFAAFRDEDGEPILVDCNRRFGEALGYDPDRIEGRSFREFYTEESITQILEGDGFERALSGEFTTEERTLQTRDGEELTVLTRAVPRYDETGAVVGALALYIDVTEQRERERKLQRERDRITALFENMTEPIVYYEYDDGVPVIAELNPAFEATFGVTEAEARGEVLDDIVVPAEKRSEAAEINERVLAGEVVDMEVVRQAADGDRVFNLLSVPLAPGEDGERGFAVYTDITDRKDRERNLQRYRTLVETVGDPMYILDEEGYATFVNSAMVEYLDATREDLLGTHASDLISDTEYDLGTERLFDVMTDSTREWELFEVTIHTESGERRVAECNVAPLVEDGEYAGHVGVVRDISERKRRQNAFEALHRVATTIQTEGTVEGVCELTVTAAADILDFTLCSLLVREGELLVPYATSEDAPPDGSRPMRIDQGLAGKTYRTGRVQAVDEVTEDDATDPARETYRSAISVPVGDHGVFQAVSTEPRAFDEEDIEFAELLVSHAASAIDRLDRKHELERQNERLEEFTSVVSHDLRNPLTVASGRLELARAESDSDHLAEVAEYHDRMERLIEDLLTLAREGEIVAEFETVPLREIVRRCWASVDTRAASITTETDMRLRADPDRLQQLFENLVRNAVEHGGEEVTVRVGELDDGTGFYVADDGPGIPPEERERIFAFGYSGSEDGTGFGLSIVDRIAEAHGWEVSVTEAEDGGARFEFRGVDVQP